MKRNSLLMLCCAIAFVTVLGESCKHTPIDLVDLIDNPIDTSGNGGTDTLTISDCDEDTVYFENDIFPILITNCAISGCHDNITHRDGINLSSYENIMASDVIDIDDPWDSDMVDKITEDDLDDIMPPPPLSPLTSEEIQLIVIWQQQGALNNGCTDCDTAEVTFANTIVPIMDSYCTGCHDDSSPSGGIDLTSYLGSGSNEGIYDVASDGRLFGAVNQDPGYESMPLGGTRLPECLIDQIRIWVEDGYPEN